MIICLQCKDPGPEAQWGTIAAVGCGPSLKEIADALERLVELRYRWAASGAIAPQAGWRVGTMERGGIVRPMISGHGGALGAATGEPQGHPEGGTTPHPGDPQATEHPDAKP